MKIAVSACLLGENCKYNGGNNRNEAVLRFLEGHEVIPVCPEVLGGLSVPRSPCEIVNGIVMNRDGECVDREFRLGAELAAKQAAEQGAEAAVLQPRSPSCGCRQIYDGSFSGKKIAGMGVFARELTKHGIRLVDADELEG